MQQQATIPCAIHSHSRRHPRPGTECNMRACATSSHQMAMAVTQPEPQLLVVFHKPQHYLGYSANFSSYPLLSLYIVNCSILYVFWQSRLPDMPGSFSQSRVTCLTYIHRPPRQPAQRASSKRAPKPSKAPHTAARRSEPAATQVTAPTTVSIPKGPSTALNRHLWGHRGPRHSRQAPQPARAHTHKAGDPAASSGDT
jgi:hypothetical protein